jgi:hypothetical protein
MTQRPYKVILLIRPVERQRLMRIAGDSYLHLLFASILTSVTEIDKGGGLLCPRIRDVTAAHEGNDFVSNVARSSRVCVRRMAINGVVVVAAVTDHSQREIEAFRNIRIVRMSVGVSKDL